MYWLNFHPSTKFRHGIRSTYLHPNCHNQVVFAKFNLSILYPPPYEKNLWFHKKANPKLIRRAINEFDWIRPLSNVIVDEKVCYFTETLLNIIRDFIPHERIFCDVRDPPWINNEFKKLINEKNSAYKSYCCLDRDVFILEKFKFQQNQFNLSIEISKQRYYSKLSSKLANHAASSKTYWSILKTFLDTELFNTLFANQCTLLTNSSILPNNPAKLTCHSIQLISQLIAFLK